MKSVSQVACALLCVAGGLVSVAAGQSSYCYAEATTAASSQVSVFNLPNGGGWPLTQAKALGSLIRVDATITLTLLDSNGDPVAGVPAEDLWLESTLAGLVPCPGGSTADKPTDASGRTTWSVPLRAGGATDPLAREQTLVAIGLTSEFMCYGWPSVNILHNSPDIDGNLVVNLSDTVLFARDATGAYAYRSDFFFDYAINLSDVVLFSHGVGASCP